MLAAENPILMRLYSSQKFDPFFYYIDRVLIAVVLFLVVRAFSC